MKGFELTAAPDADALDVAKAIVKVVDMPFGTRPFRRAANHTLWERRTRFPNKLPKVNLVWPNPGT